MLDPDAFLTELYAKVDDFDKTLLPESVPPGPAAARSRSEVATLAIFAQWAQFPSERAFYRYAAKHLRGAFPKLPDRAQFNRQARAVTPLLIAFWRALAAELRQPADLYETLDATAVVVRDSHRRGEGWLAGQADSGYSNRLGWYEGLHLLVANYPSGVITGYGLAPASTKDQPLAETFLAARQTAEPRLACVGTAARVPYLSDCGFEGAVLHEHWQADYGATVITPPKGQAKKNWPKPWRRYLASLR
jgi:hypothetical protein